MDPDSHFGSGASPMYCMTPVCTVGVVGALLWILIAMSVVAPLLWAIVILLLDLTLATQVRPKFKQSVKIIAYFHPVREELHIFIQSEKSCIFSSMVREELFIFIHSEKSCIFSTNQRRTAYFHPIREELHISIQSEKS